MLGFLITVAVSVALSGLGIAVLKRLGSERDVCFRLGAVGLVGLGALGLASLVVLSFPGGVKWGLGLPIALVFVGLALGWKELAAMLRTGRKPVGAEWAFVGAYLLTGLFALVGVLAPSTMMDWDSLAYHFAVPKLWIQAGQAYSVSFIHHSNFPFVVDNLYVWGLQWGGESGAKGFSWMFALFGGLAIYGFARERWGGFAGWWSALAFVGMPVVAWEAGTGYVDVAHGLFAGLGLLQCARLIETWKREDAVLAAVFLGFAAGSKYTGLQTIAVCALVLGVAAVVLRTGWKPAALTIGLAAAIASPWYVRNAMLVGNPVFPFFYEQLGGKHWDQFSADIYRDEQQTFGVGRKEGGGRDWSQFPHAVFGMAYQPGRYTNPAPTQGMGHPVQALGVAVFAAAVCWLASGRLRRMESAALGGLLASFVLWFALSQQSRYAANFGVPLAVLLGGAVAWPRSGSVLAVVAALQSVYTLGLVKTTVTDGQLPVVLGRVEPDAYRAGTFFSRAQTINREALGGKVALYDEVFGYWLDVPYFWANPGHSTEIPYATLDTGAALADHLKGMGFTHVYLNLAFQDPAFRDRWLEAMRPGGAGFSPEEATGLDADLRTKWKRLLAEAVASGRFVPVAQEGRSLLFTLP